MVNDSFPPGLTSLGVSETPCWNSPNGSSRVFAAAEDGSWGEDHWETAIFHGIELQPCCVFSLSVQYIIYTHGYIRSYFYIHVNERICICICLCLCVCIIICACTWIFRFFESTFSGDFQEMVQGPAMKICSFLLVNQSWTTCSLGYF